MVTEHFSSSLACICALFDFLLVKNVLKECDQIFCEKESSINDLYRFYVYGLCDMGS